MNVKTTVVFEYMEEAYAKSSSIVVHQGGTRSSKTYNILMWFIVKALSEWRGEVVDIGRKTFPALRTSVLFDFFEILKSMGLYNAAFHNKSENTYVLNTNLFRFFSVDQEVKVRGSKRSFLFLNEANEFTLDDFKQLNQRTTKMCVLDYNPSDEFHWIYDFVLSRDDVCFYKTTFRDNPFLDRRIRDEILSYKEKDPNYWRVYGLGERGVNEAVVFKNWNYADSLEGVEGEELFGMDFGFNNPTTLVRVKHNPNEVFVEGLLYKTGLTSDLIVAELDVLREKGKISYNSTIYADGARPEIIQDIKNAGYNIHAALKEQGSVLRGINFLKKHSLFIHKGSVEVVKEFKNYKWKVDKDGKVLDAPVEVWDHSVDAVRYALCMKSFAVNQMGVGSV